MKYHQNKKGNVLLYIIVTMTILTALGTGAFYMTNTVQFQRFECQRSEQGEIPCRGRDPLCPSQFANFAEPRPYPDVHIHTQ